MHREVSEYDTNRRIAERFFLRSSKGAFHFAVTDDEIAQQDINNILYNALYRKGKQLLLHDWQKGSEELHPVEQLRLLKKSYPDSAGILLFGLDAVLHRRPNLLAELNFGREALSALGIPLLFWLSRSSLQRLIVEAADLYSQRAGSVLYFDTDAGEGGEEAFSDREPDVAPLEHHEEARLTLLLEQLDEAEERQIDPVARANEMVLELLALYTRIPGNSQSMQALLDHYDDLFDFGQPASCKIVGEALRYLGKSAEARLLLEKALADYRERGQAADQAATLNSLAKVQQEQQDALAAEQSYREALAIYRELAKGKPWVYLADVATTLHLMAALQQDEGRFSEAERGFEELLQLHRQLADQNPRLWLPEAAATLTNLSNVQSAMNQLAEPKRGYQQALTITSELDTAVSWLHVSDLHLSDSAPYDQEVILRSLVASVKRFRNEGHTPDLIFVTGDIAESGKAAEYAFATQFFDDLLAAAGLGKERLFIVPGNHDVDRKMGKWLLRTLGSNEEADDYFAPETAHPHLTQKLQAFSLWYNNYFSALRSFPTDTTCTSPEILSVRQSKVAILAINSALFCMGADDHQKLLIGRRCLDRAKQQLLALEADLKIALMHHPLDWLSPFERSNIKAALGNSIDLLLHGHYHETGSESIVSANGGYLKLAAGAAYQKREWPNGAMYATFYANQVTLFPIRYEDKPHEIWTLDTSVFPSPSYLGSFPIPGRAHQGAEEAAATTREDEESVESYQAALREELGNISLLGTHALENIPVGLTQTFVSLRLSDTWRSDREFSDASPPADAHKEEYTRTPEEVTRLVFKKNRLLLIIGDPGSGKTTLLKHYAITCLQPHGYKRLGFTEPLLLFFLPLRELIPQGVTFAPLSHQLFAWSEKHHLEIAERHFASWLKRGKTLLLFDGLDEISDTEERIKACGWIDRIVSRFTNARLVVTSRATGYRKGEGIELASLHTRADIMDFTVAQQAEFLKKWFQAALLGELPPETTTEERWERAQRQKALQKAKTIAEFLGREGNKSLQMLARVPMLLQIMAILWKEREFLPGTRVELYDAALNYILDYRDRQKKIEPLLPAKDALYVLAPLSLWMQEVLGKDEVDGEAMLQQMQLKLNELNQKYSASAFCKNLVDRAGLLVEYRDKEYLFRHKSFREYMAALQLNTERDKGNRLEMLASQFGNDWWEEPLRFFIGQVDADTFDSFMQKLFDSPVSAEMTQKQQDLLMTLIREARGKKITALKAKLFDPLTTLNRQRYILQCLESIAQFEAHTETARHVVAEFRASALSKELPLASATVKDMFGAEYLLIKGGTITSSVTKRPTTVPDLYVAKYTVTNRLYRQFIRYLGAQEPLLSDRLPLEIYKMKLVALAESVGDKGFLDYLKEGDKDLASRFRSYRDDDRKFGSDDQPVVSVAWYAAKAYCLWLSLLESGGRESSCYRLPEEFEWEYAAAGVEGRNYPWPAEKGEPTSKLANYGENEGATTPVGRYPQGATPEGLCDMAGNVWEWMENWYDEEKEYRSRRGGSWRSKADALRCSSRYSSYPWDSNYDVVGFRVIRSSHSSLPEHLNL